MKLTSSLIIAVVVTGTSAQAQETGGREHRLENNPVVQACKTEMQQLCQGQKGQQAEQCLRNNESKLSSQCKGALEKSPQK